MCGIAGRLDRDRPVERATVQAMCDSMRHRGPDDEGVFLDREIGMGSRRLSVIDLATGRQPIYNEDRTLALVFNGEIYNYRELRAELETRGHRFATRTDTEVIVHLFEEEREESFRRLNGMFSIAIWDTVRRELYLARDRFGVKPLFYYRDERSFVFASELNAIMRHNPVDATPDHEALDLYFSSYYFPTPWTAYQRVRTLPPGHWMRIRNLEIETREFADYRFEVDASIGEDEAVEELVALLRQAVTRQLRSDVPLGVFLSGGLDSSSILSFASAAAEKPLHTFTLGFDDRSCDESGDAAMIARRFNSIHHQVTMKPGEIEDNLVPYIKRFGEPFGDWTDMNGYVLSRAARDHVTVILTGSGGDEIFAGYPTIIATRLARRYHALPAAIRSLAARLASLLPPSYGRLSLDYKLKAFVRGVTDDPLYSHLKFKETFDRTEKGSLYSRQFIDQLATIGDHATVLEQYREKASRLDLTNAALYLDAKVFLVNSILESTDMFTSAFSLEGRVPILDNDLVDFAGRLEPGLKLRGFKTKRIFRQALASVLPREILRLPKRGFTIPWGDWIRGDLRRFTLELFSDDNLRRAPLLDRVAVRRLLDEHLSGRADHSRKIGCLSGYVIHCME